MHAGYREIKVAFQHFTRRAVALQEEAESFDTELAEKIRAAGEAAQKVIEHSVVA